MYNVITSYAHTGATPLRHLVYRVLELPASMKPLVYDYGSLNTDTEKTYIRRIAENHVSIVILIVIHNISTGINVTSTVKYYFEFIAVLLTVYGSEFAS